MDVATLCKVTVFLFFCLDVMVYLSKKLDNKPESEKLTFIWREWTSTYDFLDLTSKGSFVFKFLLWCLRQVFIFVLTNNFKYQFCFILAYWILYLISSFS